MKKFFFLLLFGLFFVSACQPSCTSSRECVSAGQLGLCTQGVCSYSFLEQRSCVSVQQCAKDGYVGSCMNGECSWSTGIEQASQLKYITDVVSSSGNMFSVATTFSQPFNILQDKLLFKIELTQQLHTNIVISRIELEGDDESNQRVILGSKNLKKSLWQVGDSVREELSLDFPTTEQSGSFDNLLLRITYSGSIAGRVQTNMFSTTLRTAVLQWRAVSPSSCLVCDDQNSATTDVCSAETQFICQHNPVPGACGNEVCDASENQCSCASDCGPCQGFGMLTERACVNNACVVQKKPGIQQKSITLLDDRSLSALRFSTRITYPLPFDTTKDKLVADILLFDKQIDVASIRIIGVQLLEGQNLLSEQASKRSFAGVGSHVVVELNIPAQQVPESDHWLTLAVSYEYLRQNSQQPVRERFERQLEKVSLFSPQP